VTRYEFRGSGGMRVSVEIGSIVYLRLSRYSAQMAVVLSVRLRRDHSVRSIRVRKWMPKQARLTETSTVFTHEVVKVADPKFIPADALAAFQSARQPAQAVA